MDNTIEKVENVEQNASNLEALANEVKDLKSKLAQAQGERDEANKIIMTMNVKSNVDDTCEFDKLFMKGA